MTQGQKPSEAVNQINEPGREEFRTLVTEAARAPLHARIAELEAELEAVGAGGVGPLRKQAAQGIDMGNCKGGNWLTVVYRDIRPGDEARTIGEHPKVSALSWSHALNDRDAAIAAQAKQEGV
jgi:hypothetical protein